MPTSMVMVRNLRMSMKAIISKVEELMERTMIRLGLDTCDAKASACLYSARVGPRREVGALIINQ